MNLKSFYSNLQVVSGFSIFVTLLFVLLYRKSISKKFVPLAILVGIACITEVINFVFLAKDQNNDLVIRVYTIFEAVLISYFYFLFFKGSFSANWFLIILIIFFFVAIIDLYFNGIQNFDNYATSFESITFSAMSLWAFYFIAKKFLFEKILSEPVFWFNAGILIYFGGNLILFIFDNYMLKYRTSSHIALWTMHSVLNIFYNIILAVGFWKTKRA